MDINVLEPTITTRNYTDDEMNGWWDVSRVGEWYGSDGSGKPVKVKITQEKLQQVADDYDTELHYAPVTLDHVDEGGAIGYVEAVRLMGDKLQAKVSWVDWAAFTVQGRAYVNRSIEMYDPMEVTGRAYLAGFTFLGAGKPAAKGLSPNPMLFSDGAKITRIADARMQLSESPEQEKIEMEISEVTLKEKVTGWFKELFTAGEITTTPDNKENDTVELKEATDKIAELEGKLAAEEAKSKTLSEAVETLTLAMSASKQAEDDAERESKLAEFTAGLDALVEAGEMLPVERDREIKLATPVAIEELEAHLSEVNELYKARGLKVLGERAPADNTPAKPSRSAQFRKVAELAEDKEDKALTLAACDLMDQDETIKSFGDALNIIRAGKDK